MNASHGQRRSGICTRTVGRRRRRFRLPPPTRCTGHTPRTKPCIPVQSLSGCRSSRRPRSCLHDLLHGNKTDCLPSLLKYTIPTRQSPTTDSAPAVATWEITLSARKVVPCVRWPANGITTRTVHSQAQGYVCTALQLGGDVEQPWLMSKYDVIDKTGSTEYITTPPEDDRATAIGNTHIV